MLIISMSIVLIIYMLMPLLLIAFIAAWSR
jgi:hypothetical protein